ncbi:uncharacterized protein LOC5516794 isoform X2 [Nematostella vectensis]|uniref:uncharacterized protein LOC5516794 isoform X2 n=1 Tax=Nematostella vectensis TaxID=45351 RepID=UPI00138FD2D2|nr:uncharacterized protein LOC5516794 isoform X2 [Nematostella vectensis]
MATKDITIGTKFSSYKELERRIQAYEQKHFVIFSKSKTRTLSAYKKRCPKKRTNSDLLYSEMTFACMHGGVFRSYSKGIRALKRSRKLGCPLAIKLSISNDGQELVVRHINNKHNHEVNESDFKKLLERRRLDNRSGLKVLAKRKEDTENQPKTKKDTESQPEMKVDPEKKKQSKTDLKAKKYDAFMITQRLATLASKASGQAFWERLNLLRQIAGAWKRGEEVYVKSSSDNKDAIVADDMEYTESIQNVDAESTTYVTDKNEEVENDRISQEEDETVEEEEDENDPAIVIVAAPLSEVEMPFQL